MAGTEEQGAYERAPHHLERLIKADPSVERCRMELASICDSQGLSLQPPAGFVRRAPRVRPFAQTQRGAGRDQSDRSRYARELARTLGNWTDFLATTT